MPINGDPDAEIIIANLYGVSGASGNSQLREDNERLLKGALIRMAQMKDVPYILTADANVDPKDSEAIQKSTKSGLAVDVFNEAYGGDPPMTYRKDGILPEMVKEGGVTRIDLILCNQAAAHACVKFEHRYGAARGFDHVPLQLGLNYARFDDDINVAIQPVKLPRCNLENLTCEQRGKIEESRRKAFEQVWLRYKDDFDKAINEKQLDLAHTIWCNAAQSFLWHWLSSAQGLMHFLWYCRFVCFLALLACWRVLKFLVCA